MSLPNSFVSARVKSAIARHLDLGAESIGETDDLRADLGLDALDLVLIVTRLEAEMGIDVSLPRLDYVRTVADLAGVVADEEEPPTLRDPTIWGPDEAHPA